MEKLQNEREQLETAKVEEEERLSLVSKLVSNELDVNVVNQQSELTKIHQKYQLEIKNKEKDEKGYINAESEFEQQEKITDKNFNIHKPNNSQKKMVKCPSI